MQWKITGEDLDEIHKGLVIFCEEATKVYTEEMKKAKEKLKYLKLPLPVSINQNMIDMIQDEMLFWADKDVENNCVWMKVPQRAPKIFKVMRLPFKKMEKNLTAYFKDHCKLDVKVKYAGD